MKGVSKLLTGTVHTCICLW